MFAVAAASQGRASALASCVDVLSLVAVAALVAAAAVDGDELAFNTLAP